LDPICGLDVAGNLRLTPNEQQVVGAAYTAALVRLAVHQEQYVEALFLMSIYIILLTTYLILEQIHSPFFCHH
jgi:hypothetical protein